MATTLKRVTWSPDFGGGFWPANLTFAEGRIDLYSAVPLLSEINLVSTGGLNQIIAELRRRQDFEGLPLSSYFTTGTTAVKSFIIDLQTKINDVRSSQGSAAFSFTASAVNKISSLMVKELREALDSWRIQFTQSGSTTKRGRLRRFSTTNEYPPLGAISVITGNLYRAGAEGATSGAGTKRQDKGYYVVDIEPGFEIFTSTPARFSTFLTVATAQIGTYNLFFYDQGAGWGTLNTGDWSITPGTLLHTLPVPGGGIGGGFQQFTFSPSILTSGVEFFVHLDTDLVPSFGPFTQQSRGNFQDNTVVQVEGIIP